MKLNKRLLRRIQNKIRKNPTSFDMAVVIATAHKIHGQNVIHATTELQDSLLPPCGTTACIAGWALLISNTSTKNDVLSRATKLLGLGEDDRAFDNNDVPSKGTWPTVFLSSYWPEIYRRQDHELEEKLVRLSDPFLTVKNRTNRIKAIIKKRGDVAIARIDHLIETGE